MIRNRGLRIFLFLMFSFFSFSCLRRITNVSIASAGKSSIKLPHNVAMLRTILNTPSLLVLFFDEEISENEIQTISTIDPAHTIAPEDVKESIGKTPILEVVLWFKEGSSSCDITNLSCLTIVFFSSDRFSFPVTNGYAQRSFAGFKELGDFGILALNGTLEKGSTLSAHIKDERVSTKQEAALAPGVTELPLRWDLKIHSTIY